MFVDRSLKGDDWLEFTKGIEIIWYYYGIKIFFELTSFADTSIYIYPPFHEGFESNRIVVSNDNNKTEPLESAVDVQRIFG